jgi:hypothetical protein
MQKLRLLQPMPAIDMPGFSDAKVWCKSWELFAGSIWSVKGQNGGLPVGSLRDRAPTSGMPCSWI